MKSLLMGILLVLGLGPAQANKPIEIVVPFAPGGTASQLTLMVSEILTEANQPAVTINRPGAEGVIAGNSVARAAPDGKTLLMGTSSTLAANIAMNAAGIEYRESSFEPVMLLAKTSMALITNDKNPIKNLNQLKFYVRANPDKFNVGVFNTNLGKLVTEWARREGLPAPQIVLYKGSSALLTDVVGGHVLFGFDTWTTVAPLYRDQRLRVLATMSDAIQQEVKKINPKSESTNFVKPYPDLDFSIWYALVAPAGTPKNLLNQYAATINAALKRPQYQEKMHKLYILEFGGTDNDVREIQKKSIGILNRLK